MLNLHPIIFNKQQKGGSMGFTKLGKATMYKNESATEDNKQPHFKGDIEIEYDIPAGAKIGLAGWLNERGNQKSLFFSISAHDEQLEKTQEIGFDELKDKIENRD
jgi:hypothetical protein